MPWLNLRGISEEESIPKVMSQLRELEHSATIQAKIGNSINKLVKGRNDWSRLSVENNKRFLDPLGENGASAVLNKAESILVA